MSQHDLSEVEIAVARRSGLTNEEMAASKRQLLESRQLKRTDAEPQKTGLSEQTIADITVGARSGLSPEEFAAGRRQLEASGQLRRPGFVLAARAAGKGTQVVREALERKEAELRESEAYFSELAPRARVLLQQYMNDPDAKDAWQALAEAGALISIILDHIAPAFADRKGAKPVESAL
jgi:hypothetical protein